MKKNLKSKKIIYILIVVFLVFILSFIFIGNNKIKHNTKITNNVFSIDNLIEKDNNYYINENVLIKNNLKILDKNLIIKKGVTVELEKNVIIEIKRGNIIAIGTKDEPIIIKGKDGIFAKGIKVIGKPISEIFIDDEWNKITNKNLITIDEFYGFQNEDNISMFVNCTFDNLASIEVDKTTGGLDFSNKNLIIVDNIFKDIQKMGGLHIVKGGLIAKNNKFLGDKMHKMINTKNSLVFIIDNYGKQNFSKNETCYDGFRGIYSAGLIKGNEIIGVGDDGIDFDKGNFIIIDNKISGNFDDGIDMDNGSTSLIINNEIYNVAENGILLSEKTKSYLSNNIINNTYNGITIRNGGEIDINNTEIFDSNNGLNFMQIDICKIETYTFEKIITDLNTFSGSHIHGIGTKEDAIDYMKSSFSKKEGDYYVFDEEIKKIFNSKKDLRDILKILNIDELKSGLFVCSDANDNKVTINNLKLKNNINNYSNIGHFYINNDKFDTSNNIELNNKKKVKSDHEYYSNRVKYLEDIITKYYNNIVNDYNNY